MEQLSLFSLQSLTPEEREAVARYLINKQRLERRQDPLPPDAALEVRVEGKRLTVRVREGPVESSYSFTERHITKALLDLLPPEERYAENPPKVVKWLTKKRRSSAWEVGAGTSFSIIPQEEGAKVVPSFTASYERERGPREERYSISYTPTEGVGQATVGRGPMDFSYSLREGTGTASLALRQGPFYLGGILSNPYLKLSPSTLFNWRVWQKLSLRGFLSFNVGPLSLSFSSGSFLFNLSFGLFSFQYLYWAAFPTAVEYAKRFAEGGSGWNPVTWAKFLTGFAAGTAVGLWKALGFAEGWKRARKAKGLGKVWAFLSGTISSFFSNTYRFLSSQLSSIVGFATETFYLFHHLLHIPARSPGKLTKADYVRRIGEIRREIAKGYYLKAMKDIEALMKAENLPPYVKGELEALYEATYEWALNRSPFLLMANIALLGWPSRRLRARRAERERWVRDVVRRAKKGKAKEEEIQEALGYLSAKLYNPLGRSRLPSSFSPFSALEELSYDEALYYLYSLSKEAAQLNIEDPFFYHSIASNLSALLSCCIPPDYAPYGERALAFFTSRKDVPEATQKMLQAKLSSTSPMRSILFSENKAELFLQLMSLHGSQRLPMEWEVSYAKAHPGVVEEAYAMLYQQYQQLWQQWEEGKLSFEDLISSMMAIARAHLGFLRLYDAIGRQGMPKAMEERMVELTTILRFIFAPTAPELAQQLGSSSYMVEKGVTERGRERLRKWKERAMALYKAYLFTLPRDRARDTVNHLYTNLTGSGVTWEEMKALLQQLAEAPYRDWPTILSHYG